MISTPGRDMEHWEFEALDMDDVSTTCTFYSHGFEPRHDASTEGRSMF